MARDDFKKSDIESLKKRVSLRCSNPACRVPTSGAKEKDGVTNIGVAAHIAAASMGGPRYDAAMSQIQRKSIDNAIWLCQNCSVLIDRDPSSYPVGLLHSWKQQAEQAANQEIGKRLPSNSDAIDTLTTAFTGHQRKLLPQAISNIHSAASNVLEQLDPRFRVKTSHSEGNTNIGIYAKEDVKLDLRILGPQATHFSDQYRKMIETGHDVEIDSSAISIEGSKLFEDVFGSAVGGTFRISSAQIEATQKMWVEEIHTGKRYQFDDIKGFIKSGSHSFRFEGSACGGLFGITYEKSLLDDNDKVNMSLAIDLDLWKGADIRHLPYFSKIYELFTKILDGWRIHTELEVRGNPFMGSSGFDGSGWDYAIQTGGFLAYTHRCQVISSRLNLSIPFDPEVSFTAEEHYELASVADVIEGNQADITPQQVNAISAQLIAEEDCRNVKTLDEISEPATFNMVQEKGDEVEVFGVPVQLPRRTVYLASIIPQIEGDIAAISEGDLFTVLFEPQEGFSITMTYD